VFKNVNVLSWKDQDARLDLISKKAKRLVIMIKQFFTSIKNKCKNSVWKFFFLSFFSEIVRFYNFIVSNSVATDLCFCNCGSSAHFFTSASVSASAFLYRNFIESFQKWRDYWHGVRGRGGAPSEPVCSCDLSDLIHLMVFISFLLSTY
jgi:hypothetical protein